MLAISLDEYYKKVSVSSGYTVLSGDSGLGYFSPSYEFVKLHSEKTHCLAANWPMIASSRESLIEVYSNGEQVWKTAYHQREVRDLKWNQEGLFASCAPDWKLLAWDIRQKEPAIIFNAPKGVGIYCLAWSRTSFGMLVSSHGNALKLWDPRLSGKSMSTFKVAHQSKICCIDWHYSDSSKFLSADEFSSLKLWKATTTTISSIDSVEKTFQIGKAMFAPVGKYIVCNSQQSENSLFVLDAEDFASKKINHIHNEVICDMDWNDGLLVTVTLEKMLRVYDFEVEEPEEVLEEEEQQTEFEEEVLSFEQEAKKYKEILRGDGIFIQDIGSTIRYCWVKIENESNYFLYKINFPQEYPHRPPEFHLEDNSIGTQSELHKLHKKITKKVEQLSKRGKNYLRIILGAILKVLNKMTSQSENIRGECDDTIELGEDAVITETNFRNEYLECYPASSGHVWSHSGNLLHFLCYKPRDKDSAQEPPADDFFADFKQDFFGMGIKPENLSSAGATQHSIIQVVKLENIQSYSEEFAKEIIISKPNVRDIIIGNAKLCERYGHNEAATFLEMLLPSVDNFDNLESWISHPLGMPLAMRCLNRFLLMSDIVGKLIVSLHCLILIKSLSASGNSQEAPPVYSDRNETVFVQSRELIFLNIKQFAEILFRWSMNSKANVLMKMLQTMESKPLLLTFVANTPQKHNFTSHLAYQCSVCNNTQLICSVCEETVNGLGLFCEKCHHGGHLKHQRQWFSTEQKCASGCGCSCLLKL